MRKVQRSTEKNTFIECVSEKKEREKHPKLNAIAFPQMWKILVNRCGRFFGIINIEVVGDPLNGRVEAKLQYKSKKIQLETKCVFWRIVSDWMGSQTHRIYT